ncbi:hypothetical protein [Anaerobranca gottschalkii]|uniref:Uncharacterized protein n=1 Tax=Anaerobranca gottschalkii DSM 13577 TaxID=1120990 RepID=A0A1H9YJ67_9FIRM|nr:hypothetical protein [Anaerobranca gottschalkii]SES69080.1 hypothetical protein SAMN03080614_100366 [Anaerobranca gottschalkii DSM 13577]
MDKKKKPTKLTKEQFKYKEWEKYNKEWDNWNKKEKDGNMMYEGKVKGHRWGW